MYNFYSQPIFHNDNNLKSLSIYTNSSHDELQTYAKYDNTSVQLNSMYLEVLTDYSTKLIAGDDIIHNYQLKDDEVFLSLSTYNKIFNSAFTERYFIGEKMVFDEETQSQIPLTYLVNPIDNIDESIVFQVYNKAYNRYDTFTLKVKGIYFGHESTLPLFLMNDDTFKKISPYAMIYSLNVRTDSVNNLYHFLHSGVNKYKIEINTPISNPQFHFESTLNNIKLIMVLFTFVFTFIVFLQTISLISQGIYARKKEIGILKSMGARAKDIRKIYLYEIVILSFPVIILSVLFSYVFIIIINFGFVEKYSRDFTFIYYKGYLVFVTLFAIMILNVIASLIPLHKINKMKPINAIKE